MNINFEVIGGPSSGAKTQIEPGNHIIGKGENCDIVLIDPHVQDAHLNVLLNDDTLSILPLHPYYLKESIVAVPTHYQLEDNLELILTLGLSQIIIKPVEAETKDLSTIITDDLIGLKPIKHPIDHYFNKHKGKFKGLLDGFLNLPRPKQTILFTTLLTIATGLTLTGSFITSSPDSAPIPTDIALFTENTKNIPVTLTVSNGKILATGIVNSKQELIQFKEALKQSKVELSHSQVATRNFVLNEIKYYLGDHGQHLQYTINNTGTLKIHGIISDKETWEQLKDALSTGVKYIQKIEDNVIHEKEFLKDLEALLAAHNMTPFIIIHKNFEILSLEGIIPESAYQNLIHFKNNFIEKFPYNFSIKDNFVVEENRVFFKRVTGIGIASITTSDNSTWINSENGEQVHAGITFKTGFKLENISQNTITISYNNHKCELKI